MERKNTILLTVIAVATLLVAVIGATFAYFTAQGGTSATRDITVQTATSDSATFTLGDPITLTVTQENLAYGSVGTDVVSQAAGGSVSFTASDNSTASLGLCYRAKLAISQNTFKYKGTATGQTNSLGQPTYSGTTTKGQEAAELVINWSKSGATTGNSSASNYDITTLTGTQYLTSNGLTTTEGSAQIFQFDKTISTAQTDTWTVTVAMKNLENDQQYNVGSTAVMQFVLEKVNTCSYS